MLTTYLNPLDRLPTLTVEKDFIMTVESNFNNREFSEGASETAKDKMKRKHKILNRGCSMIRSLVEMSVNGTSFESLISWHERIHNLSYPIAADNRDCYPPLQQLGNNLMFYKVSTSTSRYIWLNPL